MAPAVSLADPPPHDGSLRGRIAGLRGGERLTVIGAGVAALGGWVPSGRALLRLDEAARFESGALAGHILDDLAELALAAWPAWPPSPLAPWRRAADRLAAAGRRPRFTRSAPAAQFEALYPAAGAPVLVFAVDPAQAERAAPVIAAAEWACSHGAAALFILSELPPAAPPWDRLLYGALTVPAAPVPAALRLLSPAPPAVFGSVVEQRMRRALADDSHLAGLFDHEVTLRLGPLGPTPRVDMVWQAGKVVVELDGPEHERQANYAADRHRDYELTAAGYLVLRLTNAEVELDLARCLAKVRRIVDLRRPA